MTVLISIFPSDILPIFVIACAGFLVAIPLNLGRAELSAFLLVVVFSNGVFLSTLPSPLTLTPLLAYL